jgi:translation elongation factor EF-Tu-like GTPase
MSITTGTVDFIAELNYRTTEQGGRRTAAVSGYRPQVKFEFSEFQTSGQQTFLNKDEVYPGDKVEAEIKLLQPELFDDKLTEGMTFELREETRVVATGSVREIVNGRLKKAGR